MKYLLDTHILVWLNTNPNKISLEVKNILLGEDAEIFTSTISFWEISIKYNLKKIKLSGGTPETILQSTKKAGIKIFQLTEVQAATLYKLPKYTNKDPFDRILAWQAISENFILISKDKGFDDYKSEGLKRM